MKKSTKTSLGGIALVMGIVGLALAIVTAINMYHNKDKFEVGDCVEVNYSNEFKNNIYYHKIVKVGRKGYLNSIKVKNGINFFVENAYEPKHYLNKYEKTDNYNCLVGNDTI